ncbi:type I phosphomannose isomerase catalytic subunit [Butyrivibrio proteoclasticus]|uniref:type I phosphomannose isomerase catalytic subunit n=1 Tax=Butyrivibrio proteoclasticus TaxID=43305 RepID=UPI00047CE3E1|nr:type I phosphomannose isomerase catalytic subunit [Butyrivibrio proteoclasticus]
MSIFCLKPTCKDYLWGGHRIVDEYGVEFDGDICAEAWVLSCHKDGDSIITNGIYTGKSLADVVKELGREALGTNCDRFEEFPILIKLIDAARPLSIQVHPDDEYALANEHQYGKTEMWYVLDAKDGAFLYEGFEKEITKEEFTDRIKNNTLEEVLHKRMVKRGDVILIEPGTLHAIGKDIMVAEIQQSSNVTYRIYDYGRLGADGKPRELHIDKAVDVTKLERPKERKFKGERIAENKYFTVDHIEVTDGKVVTKNATTESFVSILCIDGSLEVKTSEETVKLNKGGSAFITAGSGEYSISGNGEMLISMIP